ncbi:hypothetical protein [Spiroplasma endosymbiont of Polydrusus formosus]|uniref:hypothetical protein n=1 Tax=Spiroplasma endosymbiont of Polydrusus formosus TaxID=3139326 RepID=UPI0035B539AD
MIVVISARSTSNHNKYWDDNFINKFGDRYYFLEVAAVLKTTKPAPGSLKCKWIYFKNWTFWPEMARMKREFSGFTL